MKWNWKKQNFQKHKANILKFGVMVLATTLVVGVFLSKPSEFPPQSNFIHRISHSPITNNAKPSFHKSHQEKCDLFSGEWIPNQEGPVYTNQTCNLIEAHQNCMTNGRPDSGYLFWKWSPKNCKLPKFNAQRFLEMMRNKTWGLIGDSISRNHVQSLICTLSQVEQAIFFYHDEGYRSKGWRFPTYNLTIYVIWSPFLTQAAIYEDFNGVSSRDIDLHLDKLDTKWTSIYKNLDYMIFSTGKWFLKTAIYHEKNKPLGCHGCQQHNLSALGFDYAYRKALRLVLNYIAGINHSGMIFFRTSTPEHFENGEWTTGSCNRKVPFKKEEARLKDAHKILRRVELEEFDNVVKKASRNGVNLKLLDFMELSLLRPDGHPGPYREFQPFAKGENVRVQHDCLHWCLPGPIDSWNDVIFKKLVDG